MVDLGGLIPKERVAVSVSTLPTIFLPALISYLTMGVLVQRKRTRTMRFVLLPIALLCAYRAGSVPDFSFGIPSCRYFNQTTVLCMSVISMRMTAWAFAKKSYKRISPKYDTKNQSTDEDDTPLSIAFWNAWDLLANFRGIGWDWPQGLRVPKSSYETQSTSRFLLGTLAKLLFYTLAFDATLGAVGKFSPETGSIEGGGIFDTSLPPLSRYTRSTVITFLSGWMAYFVTNLAYQIYTIGFVLLFRQGPSQWPPLFDAPWVSTSLVSLWGYRWHQLYRECFIALGAKPFSYLFGRPGGVIGAFVASGALHYVGLESKRSGYPIAAFGFFVMHGVGILLEGMWKRCTGVRVGGFFGLVWTWFWVLLWANFMVDAWVRVSPTGSKFFPDGYRPTVLLAEVLRGCLDRLLRL